MNGWIEVPDRPGLGVTLDEKFVKKYSGGGIEVSKIDPQITLMTRIRSRIRAKHGK